MARWSKLFLAAFALSSIQQPAEALDNVGVHHMVVPSDERGGNLDVTVWYPAKPGGKQVVLGESKFFVGTPAMDAAPISESTFPIILLSHGAGLAGNPQSMSWIAVPLAQKGFVVAAPTHPGGSGGNRSAAETMRIWKRPADLTETLDGIEQSTFFREHLERGKVGVVGLSMGGTTALAVAGARIDPRLLAAYCDTDANNASLCEWVRQSGVDLHSMDLQSADRDNRDNRIKFAVVIDPAPIDVFDIESFSRISIPVNLINLGRPGEIPSTAQASEAAGTDRQVELFRCHGR
ncbi:alpha/beta hydrolase family protein [Rhizobium halophilum]|uniref:alpha/beta hydrolase family protein n=1 Tax=Rhizobium halophilum TaxID=2846852 RepID=UPI001EFCE7C3|nr:alpha/beta fold hydrolase [Rhizobium halophilum]MCF6369382.1 alpha/beta fold hydrolase [Rhizobium halophilum]